MTCTQLAMPLVRTYVHLGTSPCITRTLCNSPPAFQLTSRPPSYIKVQQSFLSPSRLLRLDYPMIQHYDLLRLRTSAHIKFKPVLRGEPSYEHEQKKLSCFPRCNGFFLHQKNGRKEQFRSSRQVKCELSKKWWLQVHQSTAPQPLLEANRSTTPLAAESSASLLECSTYFD